MDPVEASAALTVAAAFDNRNVTRETAIVWAEALPDVTLADARAAIKRHYADSTAYLMPGHVKALVKTVRADRLARVQAPVPNVNPDDSTAYLAEQRAIRDAIAEGSMDEMNVKRYEAGGWTLTGARPHYALGSPMVARPAISAALGQMFRTAKGDRVAPQGRRFPSMAELDAREGAARADLLDAARARLDAEQGQS